MASRKKEKYDEYRKKHFNQLPADSILKPKEISVKVDNQLDEELNEVTITTNSGTVTMGTIKSKENSEKKIAIKFKNASKPEKKDDEKVSLSFKKGNSTTALSHEVYAKYAFQPEVIDDSKDVAGISICPSFDTVWSYDEPCPKFIFHVDKQPDTSSMKAKDVLLPGQKAPKVKTIKREPHKKQYGAIPKAETDEAKQANEKKDKETTADATKDPEADSADDYDTDPDDKDDEREVAKLKKIRLGEQ